MYVHSRSQITGIGNTILIRPPKRTGLGFSFSHPFRSVSHAVKSVSHFVTQPQKVLKSTIKGAKNLVTQPGKYLSSEAKRIGPVGALVAGPTLLLAATAAAGTAAVGAGMSSKNPLIRTATDIGVGGTLAAAGVPVVAGIASKALAPPPSPTGIAPAYTEYPNQPVDPYGDTGNDMSTYNALLPMQAEMMPVPGGMAPTMSSVMAEIANLPPWVWVALVVLGGGALLSKARR